MATFAFVHGAWHGSWCWQPITERLDARGHHSVAVDLPCDDPAAGWIAYRDLVLDEINDIGNDLILVGHSLGGCVVPLVAAEHDAAKVVLVCSFPPPPGMSLDDAVADAPELTDKRAAVWRTSRDSLDRHIWPDFETASYAMYHDCDRTAAHAAYDRLRPQAHAPFAEPWPLERWPDVAVATVVCSDDRMGNPEVLRRVASERFGIEPIELPGSHSPFLSHPDRLAEALTGLAA